MRILSALLVIVLGTAAVAAYLSAYIVRQTDQVIVFRFGKIQKVEQTPGLKFKLPVADTVTYFDKRILDLDTPPLEVNVAGKKRLVVDAFTRFRIVDPLQFYRAARSLPNARRLLGQGMEDSIRLTLGNAELLDVVREKRADLMARIRSQMNEKAKSLGVEIVDVRIKRADLPEANAEAIYKRMNTERKQEAAEFRAEGAAVANRIRAEADKRATVIRAEARNKGEQLRGEGEAQQNAIFAKAFSKDPDFFAFYRSMKAYEEGLKKEDTRLLLSPDSEFFRYFGNASGRKPATP
ncbi:MAG: protease modulator HflC [Hyphomicrobiaceae bacterium]